MQFIIFEANIWEQHQWRGIDVTCGVDDLYLTLVAEGALDGQNLHKVHMVLNNGKIQSYGLSPKQYERLFKGIRDKGLTKNKGLIDCRKDKKA